MIRLIVSKFFRIPYRVRLKFYIRLNKLLFWSNEVKFGKNFQVYNQIYLKKHRTATVTIGDDFTFTSGEAINPLCRNIRGCIYAPEGAVIEIGDKVGISSACIWAKERITIGNRVLIGGDCILMDTDAHNLDWRVRHTPDDGPTAKSSPIVIEDDVLIGTRCIILKGVRIGARSVIGSGSVVTRDVPPDCIAAGNPCKVIRSRSDSDKV